ncbi:MAG: DUF853 family protein [Nitrospinae bacterium]|nr:DUF853 family protein [Nitrospinota bacterium]
MSEPVLITLGGADGAPLFMDARMANRHGLVAGATGTGKTVTLQVLAESFSRIGVPVFMADVKGDLTGLCAAASPHPKIDERIAATGLADYRPAPTPVLFWDLQGKSGHPIRTTISEMGPLLLSSLLELNETQTGVLYAAYKAADDHGMLLLDLKDLRALLTWLSENAKELQGAYGNISSASVGAIQRSLLILEQQGAESFFGEPALSIADLMQVDFSGNGVISLLDVTELIHRSPRVYATFLLWLLSELFEELPEVGDADRPKLVFFFDEAHLLFNGAPAALVDKIEQVVRLIRSKGVGVYFVTQSPLDIPEAVLGQLGLRIQHALRAFTPKDRKTIAAVAAGFRPNPPLDTEQAITEVGVGEAIVSTLDAKGAPTPVERILIRPPASKIGPVDDGERKERFARSPLKGKYDTSVDRESAHELLQKKAALRSQEESNATEAREAEKIRVREERESSRGRGRETAAEALFKSAARNIGGQLGRQIVRGILGSLLGGRR